MRGTTTQFFFCIAVFCIAVLFASQFFALQIFCILVFWHCSFLLCSCLVLLFCIAVFASHFVALHFLLHGKVQGRGATAWAGDDRTTQLFLTPRSWVLVLQEAPPVRGTQEEEE